MLFNSFQFLVFFIVVTIGYFMLPFKHRAWFLLAASCYFYMFFVPIYILILAFTIGVDYVAGIYIENASGHRRKFFLVMSIVANVGVLCVFKYYNFFVENANIALLHMGVSALPFLKIMLPIGLSFHTFQAMSYTIEVYRGKQAAERNFIIYALYVMFYPQLVAGPIERPQNMLHQFKEKHDFNYSAVISGLRLILWGIFKKMVIADRLAIYVNEVYNHLPHYTGVPLILATLFFTIQIYCDFSGYSDIAIGTARIMGFTLMQNFNIPYYAQSISEFWRRWHISLSTWFRDYVYFPLGGNRVKESRLYFNLFVVFTISGLWHGAGWTFIIWGALHAFYLIMGHLNNNLRLKFNHLTGLDKNPVLLKAVAVGTTFILVSFAWIFFRANSLHDALYVVTHLFKYNGQLGIGSMTPLNFYFAVASIMVMETVHYFQNKGTVTLVLSKQPVIYRWGIYTFFILSIIFFGNFGIEKFIYFQF
jgi:alginate O-acetyltransferase complex protein AlgI